MKGFFNLDNPFFRFMSKTFDVLWLNVQWLFTFLLIPGILLSATTKEIAGEIVVEPALMILALVLAIIPFPAACIAMYYAIAKSVRRDRSYVTKEYWKSFRQNFVQSLGLSVLIMIIGYLLYIDFQYAQNQMEAGTNMGSILFGAFMVIAFLFSGTMIYAFAVFSRFTNRFFVLLRTSMIIAFRHMGFTFLMVLVLVACVIGCYFVLPGPIIFPALAMLIISFMMEPIMIKYTPVPEDSEEESGEDRWWLEK
ncbi:MAG: DUF624 domain-containing protein [Lachnospiraceae bacterium]|nr:DUF624 domain-containing protein [Lachnospiraceae bacterium]